MRRGVIFDFDGVLVSTNALHYRAWKQVADEEGIPFGPRDERRLRGLGRMESLEVFLQGAGRTLGHDEKLALADRKNAAYLGLVETLTPADVLPGVLPLLTELTRLGVKRAVASSSRNTRVAMARVGLTGRFDAVVDGNDVRRTKPHPDLFLLAAERMSLLPGQCVVIEDAPVGIEAAQRAEMGVLGIGTHQTLGAIEHFAPDLTGVTVVDLLAIGS